MNVTSLGEAGLVCTSQMHRHTFEGLCYDMMTHVDDVPSILIPSHFYVVNAYNFH